LIYSYCGPRFTSASQSCIRRVGTTNLTDCGRKGQLLVRDAPHPESHCPFCGPTNTCRPSGNLSVDRQTSHSAVNVSWQGPTVACGKGCGRIPGTGGRFGGRSCLRAGTESIGTRSGYWGRPSLWERFVLKTALACGYPDIYDYDLLTRKGGAGMFCPDELRPVTGTTVQRCAT